MAAQRKQPSWLREGARVRVHRDGDGRKPTMLATVEYVGSVLVRVVTDEGDELNVHDFEVYQEEEA